MSKPDREQQLRRGEQHLKDWGLSPDAGVEHLGNVIGRDAAADLAIAARLGAHAEPASVDALAALDAASTDKLVHKEVRRALYRLEQRGIHAPPVAVPPAAPAPLAPAAEGYLSIVDGRGDQIIWLVKARPGHVDHLFAVLNDPDGLREVDLSETTRKALRAAREQLLARHELRLVEADWRYCDFVIDRALRWATEKGHPVNGDYPRLRAQLIKEPVTPMTPLIFTHLDPAAVRADTALVADSDKLVEEKELRTWFFERQTLQPYLDALVALKDSPLVLSPAQQQERSRAIVERAVEELFGGDRQQSWVRRLEELAYFFHATGRADQAKRALAAALALEDSAHGGRGIALCETLVRSGLAAYVQAEEQREAEAARGSLVLTPQQAAREAQRQRQP